MLNVVYLKFNFLCLNFFAHFQLRHFHVCCDISFTIISMKTAVSKISVERYDVLIGF